MEDQKIIFHFPFIICHRAIRTNGDVGWVQIKWQMKDVK